MTRPAAPLGVRQRRTASALLALAAALVVGLALALAATAPAAAQAFGTWRSPQFGVTLAFPTTWTITARVTCDVTVDGISGAAAVLKKDCRAKSHYLW